MQLTGSFQLYQDSMSVGSLKIGSRQIGQLDSWAPENWAPDSWAPGPNCPGPNLPLFQGGQLGPEQSGPGIFLLLFHYVFFWGGSPPYSGNLLSWQCFLKHNPC